MGMVQRDGVGRYLLDGKTVAWPEGDWLWRRSLKRDKHIYRNLNNSVCWNAEVLQDLHLYQGLRIELEGELLEVSASKVRDIMRDPDFQVWDDVDLQIAIPLHMWDTATL